MAKGPAKETVKRPEIIYVGGDPAEKPMLYTNNVEMSVSQFDLQIKMNRVIKAEENRITVVNQGTLAMSPQHAMSLVVMLTKMLKGYQDEFGKIPGKEGVEIEEVD